MTLHPNSDRLDPEALLRINAICNAFEKKWQSEQPSIAEYLNEVDDPGLRDVLLHYLIEIDIEVRASKELGPTEAQYLTEFTQLNREWLRSRLSAANGDASLAVELDDSDIQLTGQELLERLRRSELLSDDLVSQSLVGLDVESASADQIGKALVAAEHLTDFQLDSICRRPVDPLVLGDYVLLEQVGEGGMGTVYRAMHRRMKRIVAVKVLRSDLKHSDEISRRFMREVEVAAQLSHPNIVTAYDAGEQHGLSYLVCEYIDGQNLSDVVKENGPWRCGCCKCHFADRRWTSVRSRKGVIHRDIKPSNLLLDDDGNAKLLDVGLARINSSSAAEESETDLTTTGLIMGTIDYMAPEQAQNTRLADERSDIYSVGCTLYYLLTGRAPFAYGTSMERLLAHREQAIPDLRDLNDCVPDSFQQLLTACLEKSPDQRIQTAAELKEALSKQCEAGLPDLTLPFCRTQFGTDQVAGRSRRGAGRRYTRRKSRPKVAKEQDRLATQVGTVRSKPDSRDSITDAAVKNKSDRSNAPAASIAVVSILGLLLWTFWPNGELLNSVPLEVKSLMSLAPKEQVAYRDGWADSAGERQLELLRLQFEYILPVDSKTTVRYWILKTDFTSLRRKLPTRRLSVR